MQVAILCSADLTQSHRNYFDAEFRHFLGCVRRHAELHFASSQDDKFSRTCWTAGERNYSMAGFRNLMGCIRNRDHLLSRAARVARTAPCFQLRTRRNFRAAAPQIRRKFSITRFAIRSQSNDVFSRGTSWAHRQVKRWSTATVSRTKPLLTSCGACCNTYCRAACVACATMAFCMAEPSCASNSYSLCYA